MLPRSAGWRSALSRWGWLRSGHRSPTNGWLKGDRVGDEHRVELSRTLAPGEYRLIVGLYDAAGQRLTLPDGQNFAQLATVQVK